MPANVPSGPTVVPEIVKNSQPSGPTGVLRTVRFEGTVQLFTGGMPESSFVDFSETGGHPVFACCWVDRDRATSTRVVFPVGGGPGVFHVDLDYRDEDTDKVKVIISMRMRDDDSGNRRTVPLCSSCAQMTPMLSGESDDFKMLDQVYDSSYARVGMRILNLNDFEKQPLRLRASSLDLIPVFNRKIHELTSVIAENNMKNSTKFVQGGASMQSGESRYALPHPAVLFMLLFLGTPAHAFLPLSVQPAVQRAGEPQDR